LIRALTGRKKPPTKKEKVKEKKPEEEKPTEPPKPTVPKGKGKGKAPAKEAPKAPAKEAPKAPAKEAPKAPAKVPEKPTAAPAPKPEVKPPTAAPAPKPEVKPPTAAPAAKPSIIGKAAGKLGGAAGLVVSALVSSGIVSSKAQANVLSQVKSESNFVPKSESLFYTKAEGIQNTFGKGRIPTLEFAQQFVSKKGDDRSEQLANHVYAKTDGNSAPGDGWKYRGRGFLQITGKNAYKSLGDYLKIDLVSNPDLLNSPEIAAKSIPWFFLNYKKNLTKGDPKSLEDIGLVNKAVGFSDPTGEKAKKRINRPNSSFL
jgi:putative chitinase